MPLGRLFKIFQGAREPFNVIAQDTESPVARVAQEPSNLTRRVVVIYGQRSLRVAPATEGASASLRRQHRLVLLNGNPVFTLVEGVHNRPTPLRLLILKSGSGENHVTILRVAGCGVRLLARSALRHQAALTRPILLKLRGRLNGLACRTVLFGYNGLSHGVNLHEGLRCWLGSDGCYQHPSGPFVF